MEKQQDEIWQANVARWWCVSDDLSPCATANTGINRWGDFSNSSSCSQKTIPSQGSSKSFLSFHESKGEKWTNDLFQQAKLTYAWLQDENAAFPFYSYYNLVTDDTTFFFFFWHFFVSVISYIYFLPPYVHL